MNDVDILNTDPGRACSRLRTGRHVEHGQGCRRPLSGERLAWRRRAPHRRERGDGVLRARPGAPAECGRSGARDSAGI